jgi:tetratricopeptide (TPR) repeat protein
MTAPIRKSKNEGTPRQSLWNYVLTVLVSAALGAGMTWLITSQRSKSEFHRLRLSSSGTAFNARPDVSGLSAGDTAVVLGNFAYDHQRWPDAIRQYQEAIASGVDTPDIHTDLGNAFRFSGQPEKALEQYTVAQRLNPQHQNSLFNEISLFTEVLNEPGRAIPICEEFVRRFPASDKLPAVQQQLARIKNPGESNPPSNIQKRTALSQWLKEQQERKP